MATQLKSTWISKEHHQLLKIVSANQGGSIQDHIAIAIQQYLDRNPGYLTSPQVSASR